MSSCRRVLLLVTLTAALCVGAWVMLSMAGGARPALAWGNTLYVDSLGGCGGHTPCYASVQAAVDAATTGDVIRVAAGTYVGVSARQGVTQLVYLSKTVTIQGGYTTAYADPPDPAGNPTILNAGGQGRVFYVVGNITPTLAGLWLTNGNAQKLGGYYDPDTGKEYDGGGAVYSAYATPVITNCRIDASSATAGGGIALFQSPLRLYNSAVLTNQATYGGGMAIGRSAAIAQGNLFAGNQAGYGGGLGVGQSAAQILSNTIRANTVVSSGGGIALIGNPPATVQGNVIVSNTARWGGGVVISSSAALVANNIITGNRANEVGGAINLDHAGATIAGNVIQQNTAGHGGAGFYCVADTAVVTGNQILSNTTSRKGGGLYLSESAAQIVNNTIAGNGASGTALNERGGGGVYARRTAGARLAGNAILSNSAQVQGGGVFLFESAITLDNNWIATNTVSAGTSWEGGGGGVYVNRSPAATLAGNTIAANRATAQGNIRGGGVYLDSNATLTANLILSNSVNSTGGASAYGGGIYVAANAAPTLSQNQVFSNTALTSGTDYGGGLYVTNGGGGQIVNNLFAFNRSDYSGAIALQGSAATVVGNRIVSNRAAFYGGGIYVAGGANTIERNTILSNTADLVGGGLALDQAQGNRVINNIIAANVASGTDYWFCYGGGAGVAVNYPGPALAHNTIVSNTGSAGVCFDGRSADATLLMTNTIIAGHTTGVYVYRGQAILESTLWHNNTSNSSGNVTDNHPLTGDPAFVDPAAHDYHIGPASAALNAGADSGVMEDIDGDARPADAGYDIGADEQPGVALRVLKTATPMAVNPGGWITYTVIVSSVGAANASGLVLTDTLPALARAQTVQTSQGTCAPGAGWGDTVICALGALNVGARAIITLTVETTTTMPPALPALLPNIAQARASGTLTMTAAANAWLHDCHARLNNAPTDYTTVQAAVDAATQSSDVVKVAGTCAGVNTYGGLRQHVYVTKTLTIRGGYTVGDWNVSDPTAYPTTLDALGLGRVVSVIGAISPTLEGLTLQNGNATGLGGYTHPLGGWTEDAGGGIAIVNAGATVTNCRIYSSTATYGGGLFAIGGAARIVNNTLAGNSGTSGGGLHMANDQSTATGNLIRNNTANSGGGVSLDESAATLNGNTVTGNTANSGGGVYIEEGAPRLTGNAITTNTARSGGGVYIISDRAVITGGNTIAGNTASAGSGGGLYHNNSHSTVANNTIAHNVSNNDGGGAYFLYSEAQYTGNAFLYNSAGSDDGGGAYVDGDYQGGGPVNFIGNTFIGNSAWNGGGLRVQMGTPVISGNLMMSNTAAYGGGAYLQSMIYNYVPQLVQIIGNTAVSNTATRDGGGFYLFGPRPYLRNNILRGNRANDDGGGLYVCYQGYEQMINTVIVDNSAGDSGGGVYIEGASPKMIHTTLARNASDAGRAVYAEPYSGGGYYSNPVFTNTILADSATGFYVEAGNSAAVNGILWHNVGAQTGGSGLVTVTQSSTGNPAFAADGYRLTAGSPAIDQGLNAGVTYDVDGQPRPMDWGYDLGADEFPGVVLEVTKRAPALYVVYRQPLTYTLLITSAGTLNATGVVITDTLNVWQQVSAVDTSQGSCAVIAGWGGGAVCTLGALPAGATARITLTAHISPSVALGQALTNTVSARANETAGSAQALAYATDCRARINAGATEYTLLQDAVDAASPGDLIKVAGGTCIGLNTRGGYRQVVYLNKQVTIRGAYNDDWATTNPAGNPTFIHAQGGGRALYVTGGVNPTLENLRFTGGNAGTLGGAGWSGSGGGVCVNGAAPTFSNTHFVNNTGVRGAGLFVESSSAIISRSVFYSNTASLRGGGVYIYQSAATLEGNRFYANTATSTGGGVYVYLGSPVFNASVIAGNTSDYGGGVYLDTTSPRFYNTVIVDNRAAVKAGGLYNYASAPHLWHTTLARNVYTESTGVYVSGSSSAVAMTNTILVSQSVGIEVVSGTATLNGALWFGNTSNTSGTLTTQNVITGDPAFAADGYHLTSASQAINAGVVSGVATDIDGDARPQGGFYDLGADEYVGVCAAVSGVDFAYAPAAPRVGQPVWFTGTVAAGDPPLAYSWAWGDGTPNGSGAVITHTFPLTHTTRSYTVTLTVSNACPSQGARAQVVTVQPRRVYAPVVRR